MKRIRMIYALVISTAFVLAIAWTGALAVRPDGEWFMSLNKPSFMPPGTVFSICWGIIYSLFIYISSRLMALGFYKPYLPLIAAVNVLSAVWVIVFFDFNRILLALGILLITVVLNFRILYLLCKARPPLCLLYIPILLWYCFAFIMNYAVFMLN